MKFHTTIERHGKTATGLPVPDDVVTALGPSRRPAVRVTLAGHTYRTTVATLGGQFVVPVSADIRSETGLEAGDEVDVDIEIDVEPRTVIVPDDFRAALEAAPEAEEFFDGLSISHRSAYVQWIESAKKDETRQRRIPEAIAMLRDKRRQR